LLNVKGFMMSDIYSYSYFISQWAILESWRYCSPCAECCIIVIFSFSENSTSSFMCNASYRLICMYSIRIQRLGVTTKHVYFFSRNTSQTFQRCILTKNNNRKHVILL
jgi:hypothetical protein